MMFASPRHDGLSRALVRASGELEWSRVLGLREGTAPRSLLAWAGHVVVDAPGSVTVVSDAGTVAWTRPKRSASPAVLANGLLYLVSPMRRLQALDVANQPVIEGAPASSLASDEFSVDLLWPQFEDFLLGAYVAEPAHDEEQLDGPDPQPLLLVARTVYGRVMPEWWDQFVGEIKLNPLYNPTRRELLIAQNRIQVVDVDEGKRRAAFAVGVEDPVGWSVDEAGTICILGYLEGRKSVVALSPTGSQLWSWTDMVDDDRWAPGQPPLRAASGRVHVLTKGRVLTLEAGRLLWAFDARSDSLRHGASIGDGSFELRDGRLISTENLRYATVLSDGQVLVSGRRTLRLLDADGRVKFLVALPEDLSTPPIVDEAGKVYVSGTRSLFKLR